MHNSRSHDAVIRVYDAAGNVIATHEHTIQGFDLALSGHFDVPTTQKRSRNETRCTQSGLVEIRQVDLVFLPHPCV